MPDEGKWAPCERAFEPIPSDQRDAIAIGSGIIAVAVSNAAIFLEDNARRLRLQTVGPSLHTSGDERAVRGHDEGRAWRHVPDHAVEKSPRLQFREVRDQRADPYQVESFAKLQQAEVVERAHAARAKPRAGEGHPGAIDVAHRDRGVRKTRPQHAGHAAVAAGEVENMARRRRIRKRAVDDVQRRQSNREIPLVTFVVHRIAIRHVRDHFGQRKGVGQYQLAHEYLNLDLADSAQLLSPAERCFLSGPG